MRTLLRETEIDGVRAYWVDSGRPTLAASLWVRFGMVDETLPTAGWTHLIEHLALHGRRRGTLAVNGSVSLLQTSFDLHGPADAVAETLGAVTGWLADPDFGELDRERKVLTAEAQTRGDSASRALGWRYGARGPGLATYGELGVGRATPEDLRTHAARVFTRANSVLVLDGAPPAGLELRLPEGHLLPPPRAVSLDEARPGAYEERGGLIVSGEVARSWAAPLLAVVLQDRLRHQFRDRDGGAYAPWGTYEPVDSDTAVVIAATDVQPHLRETLLPTTTNILAELGDRGPDPNDLRDIIDTRVQAMLDPYAVVGVAAAAASDHLRGKEPTTIEEHVERVRSVTVDEVRQEARAFRRTLLVGAPGDARVGPNLEVLVMPHAYATGLGNRHRNWPAENHRLHVDERSVAMGTADSGVAVLMKDVEGIARYDDGIRTVIASNGWSVTVDPAEWHRGDELVTRLEGLVPADKVLPQPLALRETSFSRRGLVSRWGGPVAVRARRVPTWVVWALVLCAVFVGVRVPLELIGVPVVPAVLLSIGAYAATVIWLNRRLTSRGGSRPPENGL